MTLTPEQAEAMARAICRATFHPSWADDESAVSAMVSELWPEHVEQAKAAYAASPASALKEENERLLRINAGHGDD